MELKKDIDPPSMDLALFIIKDYLNIFNIIENTPEKKILRKK